MSASTMQLKVKWVGGGGATHAGVGVGVGVPASGNTIGLHAAKNVTIISAAFRRCHTLIIALLNLRFVSSVIKQSRSRRCFLRNCCMSGAPGLLLTSSRCCGVRGI
jgi:hypothetical protein